MKTHEREGTQNVDFALILTSKILVPYLIAWYLRYLIFYFINHATEIHG